MLWNRAFSGYLFPLLLATLFSGTLAAQEASSELGGGTELHVSTGVLNGESGEYVYDAFGSASGIPGYKLSELNWQLNDVLMLGLGLHVPIGDRISLNIDYWRNAGDGDGTMDDYDWLYVGYPWSHWSHHDDTTVREVTQLDVSGEFTLLVTPRERTRYYALVGYRQDHLDWQSRGGSGIYSVSSYRDSYVTFSDVPVIAYEQTFTAPYLGLGLESRAHSEGMDIGLSANIRYSWWAHGEDVDIHYLRSLRFEEEGDNGEWLGIDLAVDFELSRQLTLLLGYRYQEYQEIMASTLKTKLTTGVQTYYPGDSAGLDHASGMFTVGLDYEL